MDDANPGATACMARVFDIPEILSLVFKFLDRPSLITCSQVSHFWRSCSMPVIWTVYSVPSRFMKEFFTMDPHNNMTSSSSVNSSSDISSNITGNNRQQDTNMDLLNPRIDMTQFYRNCFRIRSLTIGDAPVMLHEAVQNHNDSDNNNNNISGSKTRNRIFMDLLSTMAKMRPFSKIQNLTHLKFQGHLLTQAPKTMLPVLVNNPDLQDLELLFTGDSCTSESCSGATIMFPLISTITLSHLKRLSITARFDKRPVIFIFMFLLLRENMFAVKNQDPALTQENVSSMVESSQLQELCIRNMGWQEYSGTPCTLEGGYIEALAPGSVPSVRSLSFLNFNLPRVEEYESEDEYDGGDDEEYQAPVPQPRPDTVVEIMRRFPHLERLRIGYDLEIISKPSPVSFNTRVAEAFPIPNESWYMDLPQPELVKNMFRACPDLKAIDLGRNTNFDADQFTQMMDLYGRQLESLNVWGNSEFSHEAFIKIVPPPRQCQIKYPEHAAFKGLTELDVSGCTILTYCAWMVFKYMPTLKHFRALDVTLEAQFLIGFDWVCKDLETLAIQVQVHREPHSAENPWGWARSVEEWIPKHDTNYIMANGYRSYEDDDDMEKEEEDDDDMEEEEEDGYQEKFNRMKRKDQNLGEKKVKVKKAKKKHKTEKKKKRKDDNEDKEGKKKKKRKRTNKKQYKSDTDSRISDSETDTDAKAKKSRDKHSAGPSTSFLSHSAQVQIQVCEQLGQLSKLRDLTLEGRQDNLYMGFERDCLHLTLETGLDRLEPLKSSLERLVVYQLEEELLGRKEVEWIARHWVHHQNPNWRPTGSNAANTAEAESSSSMDPAEDRNYFRSSPKFKELIGVSVRGSASYASVLEMNLNLAWLQDQCPQLVIEKDDRRNDDDFSYGDFLEY